MIAKLATHTLQRQYGRATFFWLTSFGTVLSQLTANRRPLVRVVRGPFFLRVDTRQQPSFFLFPPYAHNHTYTHTHTRTVGT